MRQKRYCWQPEPDTGNSGCREKKHWQEPGCLTVQPVMELFSVTRQWRLSAVEMWHWKMPCIWQPDVKKVYLIHRRQELRGTKVLQEQVANEPKITFLPDTVVKEICGGADGRSSGNCKHRNRRRKKNCRSAVSLSQSV